MEEKLLSEEFSEIDNDEDEEDDEDVFSDDMVNALLESIARQIEAKTGDAKSAQIVRDSKLPSREIHYVREED